MVKIKCRSQKKQAGGRLGGKPGDSRFSSKAPSKGPSKEPGGSKKDPPSPMSNSFVQLGITASFFWIWICISSFGVADYIRLSWCAWDFFPMQLAENLKTQWNSSLYISCCYNLHYQLHPITFSYIIVRESSALLFLCVSIDFTFTSMHRLPQNHSLYELHFSLLTHRYKRFYQRFTYRENSQTILMTDIQFSSL